MRKSLVLTMAFVSALLLSSCGGKKEEAAETEEPETAAGALQQLADKAKELDGKEKVDPVDFRELKALLPEKAASLPRTEATGEKSGAMGFTVSTAKGKYNEGESTVDIEIIDTGGIAGVATMAMAAWTMADIDKETTTGYEKTTKIDGYKAFEKYDNQSKHGEVNLLVGDRYIVNINASNVTSEQMKSVAEDIDLEKLKGLK